MKRIEKIKGDINQFTRKYYILAKNKVKIVNSKDYYDFEEKYFGDKKGITASYNISYEGIEENNFMKMKIKNLQIILNRDSFTLDGEDYSDLIPYIIEHEIFESLLFVKPGYKTRDLDKNHLLARKRQYSLAKQDGKLDRLFEFHKKISPNLEDLYVYNKVNSHRQL